MKKGLYKFGLLLILIIVGLALFFISSDKNPLSPSKVSAAEIIKRNITNFFKPDTIYHERTKQFLSDGSITYEIQEALPRDEATFYKIFTEPFVTLEGFRIYERHFAVDGGGYVENEYTEVK